jgi:protein YIPF6
MADLDAHLEESAPAVGLSGTIEGAGGVAGSSGAKSMESLGGGGSGSPGGGATLDEPVSATLLRDAKRVGVKLTHVLVPRVWKLGAAADAETRARSVKDWDLWGPLVFCLMLSAMMPNRAADLFVLVWGGAAVVTVNSQLLRGEITFFQSVGVLGYCVFPLMAAAVLRPFLKAVSTIAWLVVVLIALVWCIVASVGFLSSMVPVDRRALSVYPVVLFYTTLAWLVFVYRT